MDIHEYKLRQLKTLQAAYEKLNNYKQDYRDKYKVHYDKTHKHVGFGLGSYVMLYTPSTKVGFSTRFLPTLGRPF